MKIPAILFKILFRFRIFRKHFYFIHKRIFKPLGLFKDQSSICLYAEDLEIIADLDEWIQQHIYFLGIWDEPGMNFLKNQLEENDVFIDLGANIGPYTLMASKLVGARGRVIAFEPVTEIYEKLVMNISLNKLQNVEPVKKAVYSNTGNLELFISNHENMGMSGMFHHDSESGRIENVETLSLDEYIEDTGADRIKMIKIDIEGAELYALRGMTKTLLRFRPLMLIELSSEVLKNAPYQVTDVIHFMESMDYVRRGINREGKLVDPADTQNYTNYAFIPESYKYPD